MKNIKIYENIVGYGYNWFSFRCKLVFDFSIDQDSNIKIEQVYEPQGSDLTVNEEELQAIAREWVNKESDKTQEVEFLKDEVEYLTQQLDLAVNN